MNAVVLSSGGMDSLVCLGQAIEECEKVVTLSMFYGQKHSKELEYADKIAKHYNVEHYVLDLSEVFKFSNCSLLKDSDQAIPQGSYKDQIDREESGKVATYVPYRNGVFLSVAAAFASSIFDSEECTIYIGAHADDAAGNAYADCSEEFVSNMAKAINIGTYNTVYVKRPLINLTKADVVAKGVELKVPFELSWSCYEGGDTPCHKCGTCIDREEAFAANGLTDPWVESE